MISKKMIGITLTALMGISLLGISNVSAAESNALKSGKAQIAHLSYSLNTNYLGLKNQGTWELYIKQSKESIKKIPSSEIKEINSLKESVNKCELLVSSIARVNQVEKSMKPKSEGGYGNSLTIKNTETWREYLKLAKADLEKVDKTSFKKQYDELTDRINKASLLVKDIEDKFQVEYDKVVKLHKEAKISKDIDKLNEILKEAEKLGTCDRSNDLEKEIKSDIYYVKGKNALEDYIKSYNYEIVARGAESTRYVLNKDKLYGSAESTYYQQIWGVQENEPDKYFGKEINTYSFIVKNHPLEERLKLKDGVKLYVMQVDNEVVGGYSLPTYDSLGSCYSIDGKTLEEVKGLSYQRWSEQWKEKYGK